ncbi:MAG: succinate dehydrogenase cytochrome b subunit [Acidobacteriaceae bacterium]|nr:succinate dehydrogenase cytochrome b subunit [Acidobacteriaceae bacterium]
MATAVVERAHEIRPPRFWASTNGKKVVMAVTGAVLFLFVLGHMLGNLQIYEGPATLNAYGKFLHDVPEILWFVRSVLILSVVLHIWASVELALRKSEARPVSYAKRENVASSYASRTMYWSGPILLAFVVYHLLHLTAGVIHPGTDFREGDVYHNVVSGFQVWWVSAWYIFAMILLAFHIRHGAWSMFQSLGINHPRHTPILKKAALVFAIVIAGGYISIPLSILLGLVK